MTADDADTAALLLRARAGDQSAVRLLLDRHRDRLQRMVQVHLDCRMAARLDPSDVVQESMIEAFQRLPDYLKEQPLPFYPWLRQIAWRRLVHLRQHHVSAQKRSVLREQRWDLDLPDDSLLELAERLVSTGSHPSQRLIRKELGDRVQTALAALSPLDRQVLVLRYLEQLTAAEAAEVIGISLEAFMKRHIRAIGRIRRLLVQSEDESP